MRVKKRITNIKRKDVQILVHITLLLSLIVYRRCGQSQCCVYCRKKNGRLDCRMCGLPTGGKPESLCRGKFIFVSQVFSKEGRIIQNFKVEIFL